VHRCWTFGAPVTLTSQPRPTPSVPARGGPTAQHGQLRLRPFDLDRRHDETPLTVRAATVAAAVGQLTFPSRVFPVPSQVRHTPSPSLSAVSAARMYPRLTHEKHTVDNNDPARRDDCEIGPISTSRATTSVPPGATHNELPTCVGLPHSFLPPGRTSAPLSSSRTTSP
jgi:hypothetical protein